MLRYVVRRILLMIPTLFVISALVYFIIDLPPGDCVTSQIDELLSRGDPDALRRADELRHLYGLDQPLWYRYLAMGRRASSAGISGCRCQDTVPVADLIGERLALTIVMESCHHRLHLDRVVRHRRLCRDPSVQARRLRRLVHRLRRPVDPELPAGAGAALCRQGLFRPVDRRPDGSRVHRPADEPGARSGRCCSTSSSR